jgi:hypothetical protein
LRGLLFESTTSRPLSVSSKCSAAYDPFVIPYLREFVIIILVGPLVGDLSNCCSSVMRRAFSPSAITLLRDDVPREHLFNYSRNCGTKLACPVQQSIGWPHLVLVVLRAMTGIGNRRSTAAMTAMVTRYACPNGVVTMRASRGRLFQKEFDDRVRGTRFDLRVH